MLQSKLVLSLHLHESYKLSTFYDGAIECNPNLPVLLLSKKKAFICENPINHSQKLEFEVLFLIKEDEVKLSSEEVRSSIICCCIFCFKTYFKLILWK